MDGNSDLKTVIPWFVENEGAFASLDDVFREVQRELGPDFVTQVAPPLNQHCQCPQAMRRPISLLRSVPDYQGQNSPVWCRRKVDLIDRVPTTGKGGPPKGVKSIAGDRNCHAPPGCRH